MEELKKSIFGIWTLEGILKNHQSCLWVQNNRTAIFVAKFSKIVKISVLDGYSSQRALSVDGQKWSERNSSERFCTLIVKFIIEFFYGFLDFLAQNPTMLGPHERGELNFLFKVLSVGNALSVQSHPTKVGKIEFWTMKLWKCYILEV